MTAGSHHVDGITALKFARDRHSFAASDLARISDQQQLMSSVFAEATTSGLLADPFRLQQFVSSLSDAITVDKNFNLVRMADELRGLRSSDITFRTVPLASANYLTPTGQDAVLWDASAARALFNGLKNDTRRGGEVPQQGGTQGAPQPVQGLARRLQRHLDQRPVQAHGHAAGRARIQGAPGRAELVPAHPAKTIIQYPPGQLAAARLLQKVLPGSTVTSVAHLARLRVILGVAGSVVTGSPASSGGFSC